MLRAALHVLIIIALALQGIAVAGADLAQAHEAEQHCAGHDANDADCACCPEGTAASICTAQCSALQTPANFPLPTWSMLRDAHVSASETLIESRTYTPLNPPPIA